jgi:hypothetical protein
MNFAILRSEACPLKNFAVLLSYETVGNFAGRRGPPMAGRVCGGLNYVFALQINQPLSLRLNFSLEIRSRRTMRIFAEVSIISISFLSETSWR